MPVTSLSRFFQLNFRNHRKLVIVDGTTAFTGGLNVGEEYATRYFRKEETKLRFWRDTHVEVKGEAVTLLEENFIDDWVFATDAKPAIPVSAGAKHIAPSGQTAVQVIPSGPADPEPVSILLYMLLIQTARKRLWLATPYFIPDATLTRALELAVLRGVDVRVLIPDESDYRFVHWATLSYADHVQSIGVKVCLYKPGFMHQKVVLVDDHLAAVGTMNIDNRAFYLNFEMTLVVHGKEFNKEIGEILEKDFLSSRYYQRESRPFLRQIIRLRAGFVRLLAPLL